MLQKYSLGHQSIVVVYAQTHLHTHSDLITNPLTNMFWRGKNKGNPHGHMETSHKGYRKLGLNSRRPQDAGYELAMGWQSYHLCHLVGL